jgi:hypothetical protein
MATIINVVKIPWLLLKEFYQRIMDSIDPNLLEKRFVIGFNDKGIGATPIREHERMMRK